MLRAFHRSRHLRLLWASFRFSAEGKRFKRELGWKQSQREALIATMKQHQCVSKLCDAQLSTVNQHCRSSLRRAKRCFKRWSRKAQYGQLTAAVVTPLTAVSGSLHPAWMNLFSYTAQVPRATRSRVVSLTADCFSARFISFCVMTWNVLRSPRSSQKSTESNLCIHPANKPNSSELGLFAVCSWVLF